MARKTWSGSAPDACNVCHSVLVLEGAFVDGQARGMGWCFMCDDCHEKHGVGLGVGKGQRYIREPDGSVWVKDES